MKPYQYAILNLTGKKIVVERAFKSSSRRHGTPRSGSGMLRSASDHGNKVIATVESGKEAPLEADYEEVMKRIMTVSKDGLGKRSDYVKVSFVDGSRPINKVNMKDHKTFVHDLAAQRSNNQQETYNYVVCGQKQRGMVKLLVIRDPFVIKNCTNKIYWVRIVSGKNMDEN